MNSNNILLAIKIFISPMITMHGTVHIILLDEMLQNIPEKIELLNRLIAADDEAIYAFILAKKNDKRTAI